MSNPFQITFTLKQHTPIIHFQHDQVGATIRATEVKPKLDQFIMEKLLQEEGNSPGNGYNEYRKILKPNGQEETVYFDVRWSFLDYANTSKPEWKTWLLGKGKSQHVALDYKVKIEFLSEHKYEISQPILERNGQIRISRGGKIEVKPFPLYFGNMGKQPNEIEEIKNGKIGIYRISLSSFNKYIMEELNQNNIENICNFFFINNFGARQSKGFGCFYPVKENGDDYDVAIPNGLQPFSFSINIPALADLIDKYIDDIRDVSKRPNKDDFYRLFKVIELLYQFLRAGINHSVDKHKLYVKPAIFKYALNENMQWDKKSVKQKYFDRYRIRQAELHGNPDVLLYDDTLNAENGYDFKDLFGFSSLEAWREPYRKKLEKTFRVKYNDNHGREQWESGLTRFKSPFRFHVMNSGNRKYNIWFWCEKIPVSFKHAVVTYNVGRNNMELPMYSQFTCDNFLNYIFNQRRNNAIINALELFSINQNQKNAPHYQILHSICESIKENINYA